MLLISLSNNDNTRLNDCHSCFDARSAFRKNKNHQSSQVESVHSRAPSAWQAAKNFSARDLQVLLQRAKQGFDGRSMFRCVKNTHFEKIRLCMSLLTSGNLPSFECHWRVFYKKKLAGLGQRAGSNAGKEWVSGSCKPYVTKSQSGIERIRLLEC